MSGRIVAARAWCNNEVGYLAWRLSEPIPGCLGFMVTRIQMDLAGSEVARRILPAWVAFKTQSNPGWEEQDTSVWPIQKFSWRDLTLRRSRNETMLREGVFKAAYEIVPVGRDGSGRVQVPPSPTAPFRDANGAPRYRGEPVTLFVCGDTARTNDILVTSEHGPISVAFTNGILSTQNLRKQVTTPNGRIPNKDNVKARFSDAEDPLRSFLSGDVLPLIRRLFAKAEEEDAELYLALYELHDNELIDLMDAHRTRVHVILSTAGNDPKTKPVRWDTTNEAARARLSRCIPRGRFQNRMFNTSKHIGHNKFGVLVSRATGRATAVFTGSTNWTPTGLCGQTNNALLIEDEGVAEHYLAYWRRLWDDEIEEPKPLHAPNSADQGAKLRTDNSVVATAELSISTEARVWFAPNTPQTSVPRKNPATPPDMEEVFSLMRGAQRALLFLSFYPAQQGRNSIIGEAVRIAQARPELLVLGAISAPNAMPNYVPSERNDDAGGEDHIPQPAIYQLEGAPRVLMIRASAVRDLVGDFQRELLTTGRAVIHDKVVVIDPLSDRDCCVITGSHNLGFKASYANDENLLILRGHRAVAEAYAVHVLDVQDHFRFRSVLEERRRKRLLHGRPMASTVREVGRGFLDTDPRWQDPYFNGRKGDELRYFLN